MRPTDIFVSLVISLFFWVHTANAQSSANHFFFIQDNDGASLCQLSLRQSESPPDTSELKVPHLALEGGAGWVSGGRIGVLARVVKNWSMELTYGYDIQNFYGGGNPNNRYGIGLNWHPDKSHSLVVSMNGAYSEDLSRAGIPPSVFISANTGSLSMRKNNFGWSVRVGLFVELRRDLYGHALKVRGCGPNLDITINWPFL